MLRSNCCAVLLLAGGWLALSQVNCTATDRPEPGCESAADCQANQLCLGGKCVDQQACQADGDCQAPTGRCDPVAGECVECLSLNDCPLGHVCVGQLCAPGCQSDRDCPQGLVCDPDHGDQGACFACADDGDCAAAEVCLDHACTFRCASDADCSSPRPICDPSTSACVACLAKDDCALGQLCIGQVCVAGCESERDCPDGQECVAGQCQAPCVPTGPESCDGLDNDCDGRTDRDDPQLVLAPCEKTAGVCAGARHRADQCQAGGWLACEASQYGPDFGPEVCDGLDTDCDGSGDEGLQLDCQAEYVCADGQCSYSGGCTSECAQGATECSFWDSSYVQVCANIDADPCLEWDRQDCPPNSFCDDFLVNDCVCQYESCGPACCASGQVCAGNVCCSPNCPARTCGSDGCGGSCVCDLPNDQCIGSVCSCTPSCAGKPCGDNGCDGACPNTCPPGTHCEDNRCACDFTECGGQCCDDGQVCSSPGGQCCDPQCASAECGPDGCGHTCGSCASNEACVNGQCVCQPDCQGAQCGDDGCGGTCGSCSSGQTCYQGACCTPACSGKECGPNGCGGSCGSCGSNEQCNGSGQCVCAHAECNVTCCASDQTCHQGACCTPDCGDGWFTAYHCDGDGCGGTCICSQTYGPPATCLGDLSCHCPPPAYECLSLLAGVQCCASNTTCNELLGCF